MKTEAFLSATDNPGAIWFRPFLNACSSMWKGVAEALIRALARAHRWKRMLEEGKYRSAGELAEAEDVTRSFVNRLLALPCCRANPCAGIVPVPEDRFMR